MHQLLRIFALTLLMQQPNQRTGAATTSGPCSVANTGNVTTVTIFACGGVTSEQASQILELLNGIFANQLPGDVLRAKLDDITAELKTRSKKLQADAEENRNRRAQISSFMDEAAALKQECLVHQLAIGDLATKTNDWVIRTVSYLRSKDPVWASSFINSQGYAFSQTTPPEYENLWNFINQRTVVLKEIGDRIPVNN
jgi:hypothetical protein